MAKPRTGSRNTQENWEPLVVPASEKVLETRKEGTKPLKWTQEPAEGAPGGQIGITWASKQMKSKHVFELRNRQGNKQNSCVQEF